MAEPKRNPDGSITGRHHLKCPAWESGGDCGRLPGCKLDCEEVVVHWTMFDHGATYCGARLPEPLSHKPYRVDDSVRVSVRPLDVTCPDCRLGLLEGAS